MEYELTRSDELPQTWKAQCLETSNDPISYKKSKSNFSTFLRLPKRILEWVDQLNPIGRELLFKLKL